jgi:hypothetical protein
MFLLDFPFTYWTIGTAAAKVGSLFDWLIFETGLLV